MNPIKIDLNNPSSGNKIVYSKNIYTDETEQKIVNYKSIDKIEYKLNLLTENISFNEYQMMPENTYYVKCNNITDKLDSWNYYLIEVMNPDLAISTFFINIKKHPFITTTKKDSNGIPTLSKFILVNTDERSIKIKDSNGTVTVSMEDFTDDDYLKIDNSIKRFLDSGSIKDFIHKFSQNIIID